MSETVRNTAKSPQVRAVTRAGISRLGTINDEIDVFLNKVDAFAQGLSETEQAMLAHLIRDDVDEDVAGFNLFQAWPQKVIDIAPRKIEDLNSFLSSGHATGSNIVKSGGGSDI